MEGSGASASTALLSATTAAAAGGVGYGAVHVNSSTTDDMGGNSVGTPQAATASTS